MQLRFLGTHDLTGEDRGCTGYAWNEVRRFFRQHRSHSSGSVLSHNNGSASSVVYLGGVGVGGRSENPASGTEVEVCSSHQASEVGMFLITLF